MNRYSLTHREPIATGQVWYYVGATWLPEEKKWFKITDYQEDGYWWADCLHPITKDRIEVYSPTMLRAESIYKHYKRIYE